MALLGCILDDFCHFLDEMANALMASHFQKNLPYFSSKNGVQAFHMDISFFTGPGINQSCLAVALMGSESLVGVLVSFWHTLLLQLCDPACCLLDFGHGF